MTATPHSMARPTADVGRARAQGDPVRVAVVIEALLAAGRSVEQVAGLVGRSEHFVRDRAAMRLLSPTVQALVVSGRIPLGHGLLLSRLPRKLQTRAARFALGAVLGDESLAELAAGDHIVPLPRLREHVAELIGQRVDQRERAHAARQAGRADVTMPDDSSYFAGLCLRAEELARWVGEAAATVADEGLRSGRAEAIVAAINTLELIADALSVGRVDGQAGPAWEDLAAAVVDKTPSDAGGVVHWVACPAGSVPRSAPSSRPWRLANGGDKPL